MVMDAVGGAVSAVAGALGLIKSDKAKLVCVGSNMPDGPHEIECAFNPTDYTLTQTVSVPATTSPAKEGGQQQYSGTGPLTFSTNLFFDAFSEAKGDVTPKITTLLSWMKPTNKSSSNGRHSPPLVQFKWGGNPQLDQLKGFITSVDRQVHAVPDRRHARPGRGRDHDHQPGRPRDGPEPDLAGHQQPARRTR